MLDPLRVRAELKQLSPGDDTVLPSRNLTRAPPCIWARP
jgi:hypothetical protein